MPEHLVDSQPKHADPGMDSLIRHLETGNEPAIEAESEEVEASEADPGEEQETEEEPLAAEAAEEDGEDEYDHNPLVPVMVNGVEEQVPLEELMQGYSRNADYTRKTQALAEERRKIESERSQLTLAARESVERAAALASQLEHELRSSQPDPKEMEQLRLTNPAEYAARFADEQRRVALLQAAQQQTAAYEQTQRATQVANERQALADKEPAFASDFDGTYAALGKWVTDPNGGGVSVEDWNREADHRRILIAFRAWKGSEQNAAATDRKSTVRKKVANLPRIRSGARHEPGQTEQAGYDTAINQMRESGTTRDIARALQARMAIPKKKGGSNGYP